MPRNVQIGIWDEIRLEIDCEPVLETLGIRADFDLAADTGILTLKGDVPEGTILEVQLDGATLRSFPGSELVRGVSVSGLPVAPWQCNGRGESRLYRLGLELRDASGMVLDRRDEAVGFKHVAWVPCAGAPSAADPWICELNGAKVFLVGVNWTPIRAHYADVTEADYRLRLQAYKEIGFNVLRVWGGAFLEKEIFYRLCDEMGLLVWQEFPLSSSGPDNEPPSDPETIEAWGEVARSYIRRRRHHASLLRGQ
jgi:beta-mannosidase